MFLISWIISLLKLAHVIVCLILISIKRFIFPQQKNSKGGSIILDGHSKKNDNIVNPDSETFKVCVVGGGIGGMSAAYGLARIAQQQNAAGNSKKQKNVEITVLEPRQTLGGNAKTHDWTSSGYPNLRTGLSVLAWPASLFHNYETLLRELRQEVDVVTPTFMVSEDGKTMHWVHTANNSDLSESVNKWAHEDMKKWDRAVLAARKINHITALIGLSFYATFITFPLHFLNKYILRRTAAVRATESDKTVMDRLHDTKTSLYTFSVLNPLNIISLETWMCRVFGVSRRFWDTVAVPVYSSSFLTTAFEELPATIVAPLDEIITIGFSDPCKPLHTWRQSSKDVFDAMAKRLLELNSNNRIQTGAVVEMVVPDQYNPENRFMKGMNYVKWKFCCC